MFARPTQDQAKRSEGKVREGSFGGDRGSSAGYNPLWQSLALRPLSIQPKLAISQPDDPYEREADRVADRVMRMATPQASESKPSSFPNTSLILQRKCEQCKDEEDQNLHRKERSSNAEFGPGAPAHV